MKLLRIVNLFGTVRFLYDVFIYNLLLIPKGML